MARKEIKRLEEKINEDNTKDFTDKTRFPLLPETVKIYVSLLPGSEYMKESFERTSQFFIEKTGINIQFEFCDRSEIPYETLDHRQRFAIIEMENEEFATKMAKGEEGTRFESKSDTKSGQIFIKQFRESKRAILDYQSMIRKNESRLRKLIETPENELTPNQQSFGANLIAFNVLESANPDYPLVQKVQSELIAHEICHQASLYHTDEFLNDGLEDKVGNDFNLMRGGTGEFLNCNYNLVDEQVATIRDYFSGGEAFERFKALGFDLARYGYWLKAEKGFIPMREWS